MNSSINITRDRKYLVLSDRYLSAVIGILFGSVLIFGAGFSHSEIIHNAAHDVRHSITFPCH